MVPIGYNNNMQLFQTSDYVVILTEMVHNARIVPLDGRSPLPEDLRQWMGAARGHWEGDTLVIDTTNFTDRTSSFSPTISTALGTGNTLNLTERFRVSTRRRSCTSTRSLTGDLWAALYRGDFDEAVRGSDLRVRVSRRE